MGTTKLTDHVDFIVRFEGGDLSMDELIAGFQRLIDEGIVWHLQGMYGRTAQRLIDAGHCHLPGPSAGKGG